MSAFERHFTIKEIASLWGFSVGRVRSIFRDRSDVLRIGHAETLHKNCDMSIRVPESVVTRVYAELVKSPRLVCAEYRPRGLEKR